MNKGDLLKLLEPYTDDIEILIKVPMGDRVFRTLVHGKYIQCERIGSFFQESSKNTEGCIWLC